MTSADERISARSLLIWTAIQLAVLSIGAARVPLWSRFASPGDQYAVIETAVAQVIAVSLLFPILLPNLATTFAIAATAIPFVTLSGVISRAPHDQLMTASAQVLFMIVGLGLFAVHRQIVLQAVVVLTLGSPLLHYLSLEFGDRRWGQLAAAMSPTLAVANSLSTSQSGWSWLSPLAILVCGLAQAVLCNKLSTSDCSHSTTSGG